MSRVRIRLRAPVLLLLASGLLFALGVSCADPEPAPPAEPEKDSGPPSPLPDGGSDATADADARAPEPIDACSSAGWCATDVDPRLTFNDLWPLDQSAVAVASRAGRSSVLRYDAGGWKAIHQLPFLLSSVWASDDDVWTGGETGRIVHGHRQGDTWTWEYRSLARTANVDVVWATARNVYALADSRVWRLSLESDGGTPDSGDAWTIEYGGETPNPRTKLVSLAGRADDDIWVTGYSGQYPSCGLAIHKKGDTWVGVVESVWTPSPEPFGQATCEPRPGSILFDAAIRKAVTTSAGEIVALNDVSFNVDTSYTRIRHLANGAGEVTLSPRAVDTKSVWGLSADDLYAASFSVLEHGQNIWSDGGTWKISTVAYDGTAIGKPFNIVRGTRNDNIWLAGESYAFHKSIP